MLATLTRVEGGRSYSLFALLLSAGASTTLSRVALLVAAVALVAAIIVMARRPGGEERSFGLALAASLLLSPIVWAHYFILLLIPIALSRPRLSPLWFAPLAFWLTTPTAHSQGSSARIVISLGIALAIFVRSALRREPSSILRMAEPMPAEAA
jgi:hypothetical protein